MPEHKLLLGETALDFDNDMMNRFYGYGFPFYQRDEADDASE